MNPQTATQQVATEPLTRDELLDLLVRYNEATERLRGSHESLQSEVSRLTAELEQKNRELERRARLAMLGEMAAGVAHEIRNPLGGISLYADMLAGDLAGTGQPAEIVGRVQDGVRMLDRIVEDMLLFARDLQVDARRHRLRDLVQGALELARPEVWRSGLRVAFERPRADLSVRVDGSLVTRALLNLVLNAAQAAGGRPGAQLRMAASAEGGAPRVTVVLEDTCGGIDEADLPRVFNPFFTRREQGTGLGLAIVHRTIEAHGGEIAARNNDAGGATFTFTLPRAGTGQATRDPAAPAVMADGPEYGE